MSGSKSIAVMILMLAAGGLGAEEPCEIATSLLKRAAQFESVLYAHNVKFHELQVSPKADFAAYRRSDSESRGRVLEIVDVESGKVRFQKEDVISYSWAPEGCTLWYLTQKGRPFVKQRWAFGRVVVGQDTEDSGDIPIGGRRWFASDIAGVDVDSGLALMVNLRKHKARLCRIDAKDRAKPIIRCRDHSHPHYWLWFGGTTPSSTFLVERSPAKDETTSSIDVWEIEPLQRSCRLELPGDPVFHMAYAKGDGNPAVVVVLGEDPPFLQFLTADCIGGLQVLGSTVGDCEFNIFDSLTNRPITALNNDGCWSVLFEPRGDDQPRQFVISPEGDVSCH
jgi:hypothetical protein